MKELQHLLSTVRQAAGHYGMIEAGDRIAVGVSGGKDSMALLLALTRMRAFYPIPYEIVAVTVDPGFPDHDDLFEPTRTYCESLGVPYHVTKTEIAGIVFGERKEKNPCSLCANLRRGALTDTAVSLGANKLALGHHLDDAVETFMMSLMIGGRVGGFSPVTVYEDRGLTVIRPLVYTRESEIRAVVKAENVPVTESPCPENGQTERAEMKRLLGDFDRAHRGLYTRILGAMERGEIDGWQA